jgi:hypothetical protein
MRDFIALMFSIVIVLSFIIYLVFNLPNPYIQ